MNTLCERKTFGGLLLEARRSILTISENARFTILIGALERKIVLKDCYASE